MQQFYLPVSGCRANLYGQREGTCARFPKTKGTSPPAAARQLHCPRTCVSMWDDNSDTSPSTCARTKTAHGHIHVMWDCTWASSLSACVQPTTSHHHMQGLAHRMTRKALAGQCAPHGPTHCLCECQHTSVRDQTMNYLKGDAMLQVAQHHSNGHALVQCRPTVESPGGGGISFTILLMSIIQ